MLLSLLYKLSPDECRMIMIDPKMLELSVYDGIPHLLSPVVTDPRKAVVALKWVVGEMEERYRKMSKMGVRNISGYNGRVADALAKNEDFERTVQTGFDDNTGEAIFETETFKLKCFGFKNCFTSIVIKPSLYCAFKIFIFSKRICYSTIISRNITNAHFGHFSIALFHFANHPL